MLNLRNRTEASGNVSEHVCNGMGLVQVDSVSSTLSPKVQRSFGEEANTQRETCVCGIS